METIISIVTPSLNQAEFIAQTIESVLAQKGNFYIDYVIVDGKSSDGSQDIIKNYEEKLIKNSVVKKLKGLDFYISKGKSRINRCNGISYRWISEKDEGHGDAINKGFALTVGDIMGWLNSDDIYTDGAFETIVDVFNQFGHVKWVTGLNSHLNKDGTRRHTSYLTRCNYKNIYSFLSNDYEFIQQESTLWKRDLWERAGGYINTEYKLMVDGELWCRFFLHEQIYHINREIGAWRGHEKNRAVILMQQVKIEMKKAVQWLERNVTSEMLEVARNLMENDPIKKVAEYDLDFLIIDNTEIDREWSIQKVDFYVYSSKRHFLKIQANENIYQQTIGQKDNLITQKDKTIAEKDEKIKQFNQYSTKAEKLTNEKEILVNDFKKSVEQQGRLLEQALADINFLTQRLNEKDLSLESRNIELTKLKEDLNSKLIQIEKQNVKIEHLASENNKLIKEIDSLKSSFQDKVSQVEQLASDVDSLKLSLKDKESQVKQMGSEIASHIIILEDKDSQLAKMESVIASQMNDLANNKTFSESLQNQLSAFQDKFQNAEELKFRLQEERELLNRDIIKAKENEIKLNEAINDQKKQINELEKFIISIEQSYTFRVGKALIWPAREMKRFFTK